MFKRRLLNYFPFPSAHSAIDAMLSTGQMPNRTETNRNNAQHSTGPKTEAGKQTSSKNALRHGLTSQLAVMPSDDLEAYQSHVESFFDEYDPEGPTETHLVQSLADTSWRLNRVAALETNVLAMTDTPLESQLRALANLSLHTQRLSRQFEKTVVQLRELQKERQTREAKDMKNFLSVLDMFEAKGKAYDPAEDGFVFSQAEINRGILARNRQILISQAS